MAEPAAEPIAMHLRVHGRVHGVGFRDGMMRAAARLRLDGWVRNRRDGTVEALARGRRADCEALLQWAGQGPPAARVTRVESRPADAVEAATVVAGFHCLDTL